jgi:pimeloyl-ACP methyl ester carboxylesterase
MEPRAGRVSANGIDIAYFDWGGEGPPLVLLHGGAGNARWWDQVARGLAPRIRVLAPDLRGHGDTDKPAAGYDLTTIATDALAFAAALGLTRMALGGHAAAGKAILLAGALAPERVTALIPIDPVPPVPTPPPPPPQEGMSRFWVFETELGPFPDWEGAVHAVRPLPQYQGWNDNLAAAFRYGLQEGPTGMLLGKMPLSALAALSDAARSEDITPQLAWLEVPTLFLLSGVSSQMYGGDAQTVVQTWLPRAPVQVRVIENGGHWLHTEQPEAVAHAIATFLRV